MKAHRVTEGHSQQKINVVNPDSRKHKAYLFRDQREYEKNVLTLDTKEDVKMNHEEGQEVVTDPNEWEG